jgi:hypothetical protein
VLDLAALSIPVLIPVPLLSLVRAIWALRLPCSAAYNSSYFTSATRPVATSAPVLPPVPAILTSVVPESGERPALIPAVVESVRKPPASVPQLVESVPSASFADRIRSAQRSDEYCVPMRDYVLLKTLPDGDPDLSVSLPHRARLAFRSSDGLLCAPPNRTAANAADRLIVVHISMIPHILPACHNARLSGHQGQTRTLHRVAARFGCQAWLTRLWPGTIL